MVKCSYCSDKATDLCQMCSTYICADCQDILSNKIVCRDCCEEDKHG